MVWDLTTSRCSHLSKSLFYLFRASWNPEEFINEVQLQEILGFLINFGCTAERFSSTPLRKCTLHKISDELHTWFPCYLPTCSLLPLSNHVPRLHPLFPLALIFPSPAFTHSTGLQLSPCFKNCRTSRALQIGQPGWFLSKPSPTLICGFHLGVLERLFLAISTFINCWQTIFVSSSRIFLKID